MPPPPIQHVEEEEVEAIIEEERDEQEIEQIRLSPLPSLPLPLSLAPEDVR